MATHYAWRPGSQVRIDAAKAGRELTRMEKEPGGCTPETVLQRARSANSALHGHFEWDDALAAEQHRLAQAGELIRSLVVDVTHSNIAEPKRVRAFVSVVENGEQRFASTVRALSDVELRRQVLARAMSELEAFRRKYGELSELAVIFSAMDRVRPAA